MRALRPFLAYRGAFGGAVCWCFTGIRYLCRGSYNSSMKLLFHRKVIIAESISSRAADFQLNRPRWNLSAFGRRAGAKEHHLILGTAISHRFYDDRRAMITIVANAYQLYIYFMKVERSNHHQSKPKVDVGEAKSYQWKWVIIMLIILGQRCVVSDAAAIMSCDGH